MRIKIRDLQCKGNQWGFNVEFPGIRVNTSPLTLGVLTGPDGKGLFAYSDRTPLKGFEDIDLRFRSVAANKALLKNLRGVDLMLAHPDTG